MSVLIFFKRFFKLLGAVWTYRKSIYKNISKYGFSRVPSVQQFEKTVDIEKGAFEVPDNMVNSYQEQFEFRKSQCPQCVEAGKCLSCECPIPSKMLNPIEKCPRGSWE